ncbi:MAG: type II toxin-antitoxin system Phd/YefM family antitoxin [Fibrobacteres bacterium]|nr:type II toxin-antitoxin system Phd/YefM family antitoxin [Fibrobacterota bacterium]
MITASHLRRNIYQLLDEVAVTGVPLVINRRGRCLRIVSDDSKPSILSKLKKRKIMNCDPEKLVHMDWSDEWLKNSI